MVIVKLKGELGNQMFQYAFAKVLALKNNAPLKIDNAFFDQDFKNIQFTERKFSLTIFKYNFNVASSREVLYFKELSLMSKIKRKLGLKYPLFYIESSLKFQPKALDLKTPIYLDGYFQSYKYYFENESYVKQLFSFQFDLVDKRNKTILKEIQQINSVSIHVRRGDYVTDKKTHSFHGTCSIFYYRSAISLLSSKLPEMTLVFFSDDISWVKESFKEIKHKKIFVNHNNQNDSWKDLMLMSNCKHNVIANSSFSWWGAYLNINPKKIVIAPKEWFLKTENDQYQMDLIPEEWLTM